MLLNLIAFHCAPEMLCVGCVASRFVVVVVVVVREDENVWLSKNDFTVDSS